MQPPIHGQWWSWTETQTLQVSQWKTRGVLIIMQVGHFLQIMSSLFAFEFLLLSLICIRPYFGFYEFEFEFWEFRLLVLIVSAPGITIDPLPSTKFSILTLKFSIVFCSSLLPPSNPYPTSPSPFSISISLSSYKLIPYKVLKSNLLLSKYLCLLSCFSIIYL